MYKTAGLPFHETRLCGTLRDDGLHFWIVMICGNLQVGLIQIEDIKKNNDYAMWLKVCKKADCYLLDECLAKYRRGRSGSISTHGYKTLIKWLPIYYSISIKAVSVLDRFATGADCCIPIGILWIVIC